MSLEAIEEDRPVLDARCPKCGRFWPGRTGRVVVNGFGEVVSTVAVCGRCGKIEPGIIGWESDFRP